MRTQLLAVPVWSRSGLLSGVCEGNKLLPLKPGFLPLLWLSQFYCSLSSIYIILHTETTKEDSVGSSPHGPSLGKGPSVTQFLISHMLLPGKVPAQNNLLPPPAESPRSAGTHTPERRPAHTSTGLESILIEGRWERFHSTWINIIPASGSD